MAGEIKPGDVVAVKSVMEWCSENGQHCRARTERSQFTLNGREWVPWHDALPAVARLLATEPGLAAAVRRSMAALQAMADGIAGNGPGADVEYAAELIATQDVMGRLVAALEVGNGN